MKNYSKHIISSESTLKDGLIAINGLSDGALCLFVVDEKQLLIGTLTDGDIRRALISGVLLEESVELAMKKDFIKIHIDKVSPIEIKSQRAKGVTLLPCINEDGKIIKVYDLIAKQSVLPIDAVLMAGGKGLRLRPLTEKTPKPLLKVGDKTIIDYNVDRLLYFGIENIHVNVNYLAEQIESHFSKGNNGRKIDCVREPRFLGTMGSVKFIKEFHHEMVLVMNSDLFTNIDFEEFYLCHVDQDADISVATIPYSVSVPYGILELDEKSVRGMHEKPTYNYKANGGIYLIKRELFEHIPEDTFFDATDFIKMILAKGYKVIHFPIIGYWIDIGRHEDYEKAREIVKHL